MLKRDSQGKFVLKNDDYRQVRSLRLTDETWKALGIAAECHGLTRSDYLEKIVRDNALPNVTQEETLPSPCNTKQEVKTQPEITQREKLSPSIVLFTLPKLENLRDRVLFELKLGKQAPGYKAAQKALNRFIAQLTGSTKR